MTAASQMRHRVLPSPCSRLLRRPEAAAYAGVSPNTFDRMMGDGLMPGPKRVYGRVLWDVRALDAAIDCLPDDGMSMEGVDIVSNDWD